MQLNNIFIVHDVVSLGVLAVINPSAPDSCEPEFLSQLTVNGGGHVHNGRANRQCERVCHIGGFARRLGVNANDIQ